MNCKHKSFMTKKKAFTLIELLIVIAIIGILFIVLVSKVDFATDKAKATGVQTDFRSFQMAFDTVAKENAGFNTFGWDTGDANQDGVRNSYDEGDINKDGIQNGTEVFTGHKVYAETFTKVFSLKKNGTGSYDRDALNRLETAINANLDPKLHITIKDDGEIVMANGAQDPWDKEYHGYYISNAETDGKDRGAIVMYSDGANNEFGSEHTIANGIVKIIVPGSNKAGKDDYSIVSLYTYINGYGEVKNMTTGFIENNQILEEEDVKTTREAGLYAVDGTMTFTWNELVTNGYITVVDNVIVATQADVLIGELVVADEITSIGETAFMWTDWLTSVEFSKNSQLVYIGAGAFHESLGLQKINIPDSVTMIDWCAFFACAYLEEVIIGENSNLNELASDVFRECVSLKSIKIPEGINYIPGCIFELCRSLEVVELPTNITEFGYMSFYDCRSLTTIKIPKNVKNIANSAFEHCINLETIEFEGTIEEWSNIEKGENWNKNTLITKITCANGSITIDK